MGIRWFLDSDTGFYTGVGLFTILVFAVGLGALAVARPDGIGNRELVGFVVGFGFFMLSYFIAMSVYRLVPE